jgi:hypothetical protein
LTLAPAESYVIFAGHVDTEILGAGFASQRTNSDALTWDLSEYQAIELELPPCDCKTDSRSYWNPMRLFFSPSQQSCDCASKQKTFTFILKDVLLPTSPDTGREKSGICWEQEFVATHGTSVQLSFDGFRPFYRGKLVEEKMSLKKESIKRFAVMFRSHFGEQKGNFELKIAAIRAMK